MTCGTQIPATLVGFANYCIQCQRSLSFDLQDATFSSNNHIFGACQVAFAAMQDVEVQVRGKKAWRVATTITLQPISGPGVAWALRCFNWVPESALPTQCTSLPTLLLFVLHPIASHEVLCNVIGLFTQLGLQQVLVPASNTCLNL